MTQTTFHVISNDHVRRQRRRRGRRHPAGCRYGARHHLLGDRGGDAACSRLDVVSGQIPPTQSRAQAARRRRQRSWRAGAPPAWRATTCWRGWHARRTPRPGAPMSEKQLVDNLVTFLAAGHETTAKALTWTLYLLARAPQWQERVLRGGRAVAGTEAVSAEHLERLPVTRAVLKEAMRLYPPAPIMTRLAAEDIELGGRNHPRRHDRRHPDLRRAPPPAAVGGPRPLRSGALRARARGQVSRARSSCRSASARAPASAPPSP